MSRLLAIIFAFFATAAYGQYGTPNLQIDKSGSTRCLYVSDLNNTTATDKARAFGCIDGKGAWNLPPALRNTKEITETDLRGYGYVGDGASHPLSGITSLNGRSTAGWTLSQWQTVLPAAQALSDEIDWAVLQTVITNAGSGALKIKLGPGTAMMNRALKICAATVAIDGAGDQNTTLLYTADVNGIEKCINSPDTGRTSTPIYLRNLAINKSTNGGTGRGIYGKWVPGAIGGALDNVRVNNFNQAVEVWSAGGWDIDHLFANSGVAAGGSQGDGFRLMGNTVFAVHIQNSQMQGFADAWHFEAAADYAKAANAGMEDIALRNSGAGDAKVCVRIKSTDTNYSPLQWNVENMACQAYEGFVYAEQAAALTVNGGSWIISQPTGSWTGVGKDFFLFGRVESASLRNAWLTTNQQTMTISSYIRLYGVSDVLYGGQAHGVTIENNKFEYTNLTASNNLVWKEFGATAIRVANSQFTFNFGYVATPPSNAFKWVDNSTETDSLVRTTPGVVLNFSGSVSGVASTTAVNVATVALPPGKWTCSSNIYFTPSGGASISVLQGGYNTVSATMPTTPALGMITEGGTWTGGVSKAITSWTIDFTTATANTNVYLVGLAAYSGGTLGISNAGQCIRLR